MTTLQELAAIKRELEAAMKDLRDHCKEEIGNIERNPAADTGFPTKGYALRSYRWSEDIENRWEVAMAAMDIPAMMRISQEMDNRLADMADILGIDRTGSLE